MAKVSVVLVFAAWRAKLFVRAPVDGTAALQTLYFGIVSNFIHGLPFCPNIALRNEPGKETKKS
jgi:hypothetical protein